MNGSGLVVIRNSSEIATPARLLPRSSASNRPGASKSAGRSLMGSDEFKIGQMNICRFALPIRKTKLRARIVMHFEKVARASRREITRKLRVPPQNVEARMLLAPAIGTGYDTD